MNPNYKKRVIQTCRRYYNAIKTYGEPHLKNLLIKINIYM